MAKASFKLPDGTVVSIEGNTDEIHKLLQLYAAGQPKGRKRPTGGPGGKAALPSKEKGDRAVDHAEIINLVKTCDEAEAIEKQILDRTGLVNRTLLPLYIVHEHLDNAFGLTSGDISKVTTDLGIPVSTPHASTTLSKTAARYVIGDKTRKRGRAVLYKLSRRGVQYMKSVVSGETDEK